MGQSHYYSNKVPENKSKFYKSFMLESVSAVSNLRIIQILVHIFSPLSLLLEADLKVSLKVNPTSK